MHLSPTSKLGYLSFNTAIIMPSANGPLFIVDNNRCENRSVCADFWSDKNRTYSSDNLSAIKKSVRVLSRTDHMKDGHTFVDFLDSSNEIKLFTKTTMIGSLPETYLEFVLVLQMWVCE